MVRGETVAPPRKRSSELTVDKVVLEWASLVFRYGPATHRHSGAMHRFRISADQIMPVGKRLSFGPQAIGAGRWKPGELRHVAPREPDAIGHESTAFAIVRAPPALPVEQPAGDVGRMDRARIRILRLVQAAFAAAVAKRLPLCTVQLGERTLPETVLQATQRSSSLATPSAPSS